MTQFPLLGFMLWLRSTLGILVAHTGVCGVTVVRTIGVLLVVLVCHLHVIIYGLLANSFFVLFVVLTHPVALSTLQQTAGARPQCMGHGSCAIFLLANILILELVLLVHSLLLGPAGAWNVFCYLICLLLTLGPFLVLIFQVGLVAFFLERFVPLLPFLSRSLT